MTVFGLMVSLLSPEIPEKWPLTRSFPLKAEDSNAGPHACKANAFLTELSSLPLEKHLLPTHPLLPGQVTLQRTPLEFLCSRTAFEEAAV